MSPKEFFNSTDPGGIFFLDAPSSREVAFAGILITSQWTQFCATGCGSTIERANDFVPEGAFFHDRGTEIFFPPAPGIHIEWDLLAIFECSDVISIYSLPRHMVSPCKTLTHNHKYLLCREGAANHFTPSS
jgi:hypothetical protein